MRGVSPEVSMQLITYQVFKHTLLVYIAQFLITFHYPVYMCTCTHWSTSHTEMFNTICLMNILIV